MGSIILNSVSISEILVQGEVQALRGNWVQGHGEFCKAVHVWA